MELFYNEYEGDGPPLIVLHGLLGASGNWHTLSKEVFSEVAHVYALDQRNHGRSPHAPRLDYESMAADVRDFIDQHDLGSAVLLGHSMGGKTAMQAALDYPEIVDRLIVADMTPKAYPPKHTDLLEALMQIDPTAYDSRSEIDDELKTTIKSLPIRQFLLKNLQYDGDTYTWQMNLPAIADNYDAINDALPSETQYNGPTLVVRGGQSDYVGANDEAIIRRFFPAARLETIEEAGHWVHADTPQAFGRMVVQFLTEST